MAAATEVIANETEIKQAMGVYTPNAETLAAFAETEEMLRTGNFGKCYSDAESMLNDILRDEE